MLLPRKADDLSVDWGGSPCPYLPATDGNDCPLHLAILVARAVNWRNQAIALIIYPAARLLPYFLRPNRRLISSLEKDSGAKSPSHAQTFS